MIRAVKDESDHHLTALCQFQTLKLRTLISEPLKKFNWIVSKFQTIGSEIKIILSSENLIFRLSI